MSPYTPKLTVKATRIQPFSFCVFVLVFIGTIQQYFICDLVGVDLIYFTKVREISEVKGISAPKSVLQCTKDKRNKGIIILDLLGRLGNNIFEVGFANRLAEELCWDVIYRNAWTGQMLKERNQKCFPQALLPPLSLPSNHSDNQAILFETSRRVSGFRLSDSFKFQELEIRHPSDKKDMELLQSMKKSGQLLECHHMKCDFSEMAVTKMIANVSHPESSIRVIHLKAFFVHGGWLQQQKWQNKMQEWFTFDPSCCITPAPPENAIVIHIRDFTNEKERFFTRQMKSSVYKEILQNYGYTGDQPVWIVCQPKSVNSTQVTELQSMFSPRVEIHTGEDAIDAMCIVRQAKVLVTSYGSTFSQAAALIGGSSIQEVHVPVNTIRKPEITISIPSWKVHLVNETKDGIKEFDVPHDHFKWKQF